MRKNVYKPRAYIQDFTVCNGLKFQLFCYYCQGVRGEVILEILRNFKLALWLTTFIFKEVRLLDPNQSFCGGCYEEYVEFEIQPTFKFDFENKLKSGAVKKMTRTSYF